MRDKVVSAAEAVAIIRPGDMVATSGFVGVGTPDAIFVALEERFLATGQPRDLGLLFAAAPGDGKEKGLNRLAHDGLIRRAVGGHWSLVPKLGKMAADGLIEAWNLPLGCVSQLFREIAGRRPGLLSRVGIGTFVDPRHGGGKLNAISATDLVRVMEIDGQEWLFYQAIPVDVAIIRGTTADPDGNISMEREALILDNLAIAMAAKASKGFVIAQVERLAAADALPAKQVVVPGVLVDCVVLATGGAPRPDLRHRLQPGLLGPAARAARPHPALGPGRAQDHRPPLCDGAADGRRGQSRHRHARGGGGGGQGGEPAAAGDAHRRARDHRRPAAGWARLRRRDQPERHHRPEPAVRLLRRRRARPRLPRHGAGRRPGQRQCQPVRRQVRRCRRVHQHHPERPGAGLRRHLHGRRAAVEAGEGTLRDRAGGAQPQVRGRGRAGDLQRAVWLPRPGNGCSMSPSVACSG